MLSIQTQKLTRLNLNVWNWCLNPIRYFYSVVLLYPNTKQLTPPRRLTEAEVNFSCGDSAL
jgi:hypothetical protein